MQIGLLPLLGIIFIVLKLAGLVGWSWLWVLAPFWICAGLYLFILAVIALIAGAGYGRLTAKRRG